MAQDATPGNSSPRKVGLVVIHGVGEAEPGWCLNAVLQSLQKLRPPNGSYTADEHSTYITLPEAPWDDPVERAGRADAAAESKWPVFRQCARYEPKGPGGGDAAEIHGAEVYWADTTSLKPGGYQLLAGLLRVVFESHHLVYAMLQRSGRISGWAVRNALRTAAWLLRGPIAALTAIATVYCSLLLFEPRVLASYVSPKQQFLLVLLAAVLAAYLAVLWVRKTRFLSWYDVAFWLGLFAILLAALAVTGKLDAFSDHVPSLNRDDFEWGAFSFFDPATWRDVSWRPQCDGAKDESKTICGLYATIVWLWRIWGGILLFTIAVLVFRLLGAGMSKDLTIFDRMATSISILIIQFVLWTTVIVTLIYPMLLRAEANMTLSAVWKYPESQALLKVFGPGADGVAAEKIESDEVVRGAVKQLFDLPPIELEWISRFKFIYVLTALALLATFAGVKWIERTRDRRAAIGLDGLSGEALREQLESNLRRMPRLLFSPILAFMLIAIFLGLVWLMFNGAGIEKTQEFKNIRTWVLPATAIIVVAATYFADPRRLSNIIHIARDMIDYHYQPQLETGHQWLPNFFKAASKTPRRDRINRRVEAVLDSFVKNEGFDDVVFVTHSQGSIIAYDYLVRVERKFDQLGDSRASLLTFGSPLGVLYQKYFPTEYEETFEVSPEFLSRMRCWINLYRIDDYIGGPIKPPLGFPVANRIMTKGQFSHINYWHEPALAEALDEIIQHRHKRIVTDDPASWPRDMSVFLSRPTAGA